MLQVEMEFQIDALLWLTIFAKQIEFVPIILGEL
jgi:hypothetical protein